MKLAGKRALVTGASRGIGKAIALALGREGADVAVNYVSESASADAVVGAIEAMGRRAWPVRADVSRRDDVEAMFDEAWDHVGPLDILINNAGIETIVPLADLTDDAWDRVTDVNLRGPWLCSQVFARRLDAEDRSGSIVNIGSVQAGLALPGRTHYAPTKRGVEGLTANLAAELGSRGIRVNCVHPGVIDTDMTQWVTQDPDALTTVLGMIPLGRVGRPDEVAAITVLLASDDASYITGQHIYVDGGMRIV